MNITRNPRRPNDIPFEILLTNIDKTRGHVRNEEFGRTGECSVTVEIC